MTDETIFATALEKPSLAERDAFVAECCGNDAELRRRIGSLLAAHDKAGEFLNQPAVAPFDPMGGATQALGEADSEEPGATRLHPIPGDEVLGFLQSSTRPGSLGRLGHYEVLEILGRGGFGIVLRAFDDKLQRVVAVKVLAPEMAATSPARKRFLREARASAPIRHENVVQVYAIEEQPLPYIVMEYIPGETLQQLLDRTGPLEIVEILRIGFQIAEGLAAAHETGLIHRDVKPANVLLEGGVGRRAKLTDFGLARAADDASISQSGVVAGTPMYMAPEQARGDTLDHRADLFSLGSVLYVMCTGRPPFRANSTLAVLKRVVEEDPRPIREIIPEMPVWFCRIVEKLHAKDPEERFQSAREVADLLADCESQLMAHSELKDYARIPETAAPESEPYRFQWWKWLAGLLAFMLFVPVVLYALLKSSGGSDTALVQKPVDPAPEPKPAEPTIDAAHQQRITDMTAISVAYHTYCELHRQAPTQAADLKALLAGSPRAWKMLNNGSLTFLYRVLPIEMIQGTSNTILAYEANAPTAGGLVLRGDGSVQQMTATEFKGYTLASPPPPWAQLFNGKDLTGWQLLPGQRDSDIWKVKEGILVGNGPQANLFSEKSYRDFHLRVEARVSAEEDSGIFFRAPFDLLAGTQPYEVQIIGIPVGAFNTGSLWGFDDTKVPVSPIKPGEWFTLEVIAQGNHLIVKVNGKSTVDWTDPKNLFVSGHLALQHIDGNGAIEFRKIEIKELPVQSKASSATGKSLDELKLLRDAAAKKWENVDKRHKSGLAPILDVIDAAIERGEADLAYYVAEIGNVPRLDTMYQQIVFKNFMRWKIWSAIVESGKATREDTDAVEASLRLAEARWNEARKEWGLPPMPPNTLDPETAPPPRPKPS